MGTSGCFDIIVGTRLHNGRWNVKQPGYGTVMKVNMDADHKEVESYDVLMDDAESIVTIAARYVEVDVKYARTHVASGKGSPAGERGRSYNRCVSHESSSKEAEDIQVPAATNNDGTGTGKGDSRSGLEHGGDTSRNNRDDDKPRGKRGMACGKKGGDQSRKDGYKGQKKGKSDDEGSDSSTDAEMSAETKGRQGSKAISGGQYQGDSDDEGSNSGSDGGKDSGSEYSEGSGDGSDSDESDASREKRETRRKQRKRNRRRRKVGRRSRREKSYAGLAWTTCVGIH
ncbi:unnamed protein product [Ectocarpus sp. CCAP 1310/34]|nr:unnamed protein product [Ectocarpus sp. CCAP 1310/34]